MASVYRQATRSQNWVARFKGPDGKWCARSTGLTDRASALKLAFLWEGNLTDEAMADPTAARIDKVVRSIYEGITGSKIEKAPTATYLREWAVRVTKLKSANTAERYSCVVEDFISFLGEKRAVANLSTVRSQDLQKFIDSELEAGKSAGTAGMSVKILRIPFNIALRQGIISKNPCLAVELPDELSESRDPFTWPQVQGLIAAADDEWKTVVMLGAFTGMRLGDAISQTWSAVDLDEGVISFVPQKNSRGRRRKTVHVPLHPDLAAQFVAIGGKKKKPTDHLTPTLGAARIGGRSGLSRDFIEIMNRAGIECEAEARKNGTGKSRSFRKLSFHSLRHSFNSQLANAGVDQELRQRLTGHASAAMNQRYTHLELSTMREAVAKLPGVA